MSNINGNTVEKLKELIKNEYPDIDFSKLTEDTVLKSDLGIDSLELMLLIVRIEEEFKIDFDNFPYVETIGDLLTVIENNKY